MEKLLNAVHSKKGFTLVEIIVVLVILAILMAAAIPAMMGFINNSRAGAFTAEARTGYAAAQTIATELAGMGLAERVTDDMVMRGNLPATSNITNYRSPFAEMTGDVTSRGFATSMDGTGYDHAAFQGGTQPLNAAGGNLQNHVHGFHSITSTFNPGTGSINVTGIRYNATRGPRTFEVVIDQGNANARRIR